ncbi:TRADD-N-associated membrane domain-containing protein [Actinomadura verrucosospora]|uniref:Cyanobacterial TRADD-N associated 2 transmembrane domain-containing protein n=1 Tax=Actinomadura verrucosospora TaxID=46165 RepID=A0A7D3ZEH6_ACTVE|nr:hypothetical protein [Actinomadura verrucosospora]QKG21037.1 hypothetical protein ACTIVE_2675 [Actinomadura verrucosospora]
MAAPPEAMTPRPGTDGSHEPTLTVEQLKVIWQGTPEGRVVARVRKVFWAPLVLIGLYLAATFWWDLGNAVWQRVLFESLGAVAWVLGCAVAFAVFEIAYADPKFNNYQIQFQREQLLADYQTDLNASLELSDLWVLNQRRLDLYHQIATNQAKSSFRYAQLAAGLGFLVLIGAAVTVWFSDSTTTAVTTGAIGVFGGSLGAYLGGTFMNVQRAAAEQLRQYFDHPLELSKILISERLLENIPADQRVESVQHLMRSVLAGRALPGDAAAKEPQGSG